MKFVAAVAGLIGVIESKFWPKVSEYRQIDDSLAVPLKSVCCVSTESKLNGEVNVNAGGVVSGVAVVARIATLERDDHKLSSRTLMAK